LTCIKYYIILATVTSPDELTVIFIMREVTGSIYYYWGNNFASSYELALLPAMLF